MKMKKIFFAFAFVLAVPGTIAAGEITSRRLPFGLNDYIRSFSNGLEPMNPNNARIAMDYYRNIRGVHADAVAKFAQLEGNSAEIDTAIEWLYASYYHVAVRDIRPPEAEAILPANNPREADLKLGFIAFQEIQILRFLGNTRQWVAGKER